MAGLPDDAADEATTSSSSPPLPRAERFAGTFVSGTDSLRIVVRQSRPFFRFGATEQPMRVVADSAIAVVDTTGEEQQRFLIVRGRATGALYLHDGISAFRRIDR
jgi:hypothetical protein